MKRHLKKKASKTMRSSSRGKNRIRKINYNPSKRRRRKLMKMMIPSKRPLKRKCIEQT
jgi:hypothetical protein